MPLTLSGCSVFFLMLEDPRSSAMSRFHLINPSRHMPLITNVISLKETDVWIGTANMGNALNTPMCVRVTPLA